MKLLSTILLFLIAFLFSTAKDITYKDLVDQKEQSILMSQGENVLRILISPEFKNSDISIKDSKGKTITTTCTKDNMYLFCIDLSTYFITDKSVTIIVDISHDDETIGQPRFEGQSTLLISSTEIVVLGKGNSEAPKTREDIKPLGIAYYDAKNLSELSKKDFQKCLEILSAYSEVELTSANYKTELSSNKFLLDLVKQMEETKSKGTESANIDFGNISSAVSSFMTGTDITPYVQAIADFLRDRMKQEITLAFIDRMKQMLDTVPELKYMLPNTYNTFTNTDPFLIPTMGQMYKESFLKDIENSVFNFETMVYSLDKYKDIRNDQSFTIFISSYRAVDMFGKGFHIPDVLDDLDSRYGKNDADATSANYSYNRSLRIMRLLSNGLRNNDTTHSYISTRNLSSLSISEMNIFMGLIYQSDKKVFDNFTFTTQIDGCSNLTNLLLKNLNSFKLTLKDLLILSQGVDERIQAIEKIHKIDTLDAEKKQQQIAEYYLRNCDILNDILDFGLSLSYFRDRSQYLTTEYYTQWRPVIKHAIDIGKSIPDKNYGAIATSSIQGITKIVENLAKDQEKDLAATASISTTHATRVALRKELNSLTTIKKFPEKLSFFYNFITDMANADSSINIKKILDKYSDPVGSYKIKRQSFLSVSLNAYPGFYSGMGFLKVPKNAPENNTYLNGITAPIGLSFNWSINHSSKSYNKATTIGVSKNKSKPFLNKTGWSHTVFVGIIDIGAALNFRFNNDSVSVPTAVTTIQIFSPGLFYVLGVKKIPLSISVGAQFMPQLREITEQETRIEATPMIFVGGSLTIDIPIFHFMRKENKNLGY